ncbi:MAG: SpoIIIAH-like family protein [Lachnospiraceae bacterium]|nr:SpoIIIAH-like family protein [Lachnospiraceae bacterium]
MKSLLKKNQLMITSLAIMLAIAGYLQFAGTNLEDEYLQVNDMADAGNMLTDISDEDLLSAGLQEIDSMDEDGAVITENYLSDDMSVIDVPVLSDADTGNGTGIPGEAVFTGNSNVNGEGTVNTENIINDSVASTSVNVAIMSEAKLLKEQTRAKNKETLLDIINSEGLTDAQKQTAVDNMVRMTAVAEKELAAEILLEAKGFADVIVSINGDCADVVVNAAQLTDIERAQIEDIVKRKAEIPAENIIISTVSQ